MGMINKKIREALIVACFVILCVGFTLLVSMLFASLAAFVNHEELNDFFARIGQLMGILAFFILWFKRVTIFEEFGLRVHFPSLTLYRSPLLPGIILGFGAQLAIFLSYAASGSQIHWTEDGFWLWLILVLVPAFVIHACVAVTEELLFRGYLLAKLASLTNFFVATVLQAFLFSMAHIFNKGFSPAAVGGLMLFGCLMAFLKLASDSLWFPIAFHAFWNIGEGAVFGFKVSGFNVEDSLIQTRLSGETWWTGGRFGPEAGIPSIAWLMLLLISFGIFSTIKQKVRLSPLQEKRVASARHGAKSQRVRL
jgi:membrane protease YdiL (CAAX protease family)